MSCRVSVFRSPIIIQRSNKEIQLHCWFMEEGRTQHPNIAKAARLCFRWQLFALRHHAPWTQLAAMLLATTHFKASTEVEDSWELRIAMQSREVARLSQIEAIQDTFQKQLLKKQSFHIFIQKNAVFHFDVWHSVAFPWHFHGSLSQGPEHGLRAQHPRRVASGLLRVASRVWPSGILYAWNCGDCSWSIEIFFNFVYVLGFHRLFKWISWKN